MACTDNLDYKRLHSDSACKTACTEMSNLSDIPASWVDIASELLNVYHLAQYSISIAIWTGITSEYQAGLLKVLLVTYLELPSILNFLNIKIPREQCG